MGRVLRSHRLHDFFFNDPATTEIYTLSLHDALPILAVEEHPLRSIVRGLLAGRLSEEMERSEEHTSELQSDSDLVCRLLLEKKKSLHYKAKADHNVLQHIRRRSHRPEN